MDVQTPETPGRLSLRLDVYSPPQVLQIDGRLCHLVLAFPIERDITNRRAPSLRGSYSASSLLRTHPPPSRLRSTSRLGRLFLLRHEIFCLVGGNLRAQQGHRGRARASATISK